MSVSSMCRETKAAGEFSFSDNDFQMIADLANERYGLYLQLSKKALVYSRLAKRLRALQLPNFETYCALLDGKEGDEEQVHLLSALTTNVTHFFREMHHFDYLGNTVATALLARAREGHSVRIWSSACSAGQEAYSIAATLMTAVPDIARYDLKILATDIDPKIIQTAKRGFYSADQLDAIPAQFRSRILTKTCGPTGDIEIHPDLRKMISFGELNLIKDWPMRRRFDVIFCRNAAIYFDKRTQSRLWQRFADHLIPGGHLMIGHSERLSGPAKECFKSVGITTYAKIDTANSNSNS